jgi:hypothetical protein
MKNNVKIFVFKNRLNYIDRPLGSGEYLTESAFCALLDDNIYPKVRGHP